MNEGFSVQYKLYSHNDEIIKRANTLLFSKYSFIELVSIKNKDLQKEFFPDTKQGDYKVVYTPLIAILNAKIQYKNFSVRISDKYKGDTTHNQYVLCDNDGKDIAHFEYLSELRLRADSLN